MSDIELDPRWIEYKMEQYKEKKSQIMNDKSAVKAQNKNELKCPFCQQELDTGNYFVHCHNPHCDITEEMEGTEEMWEALIRTRKALDVAVDALKDIRCVYTGDQTTKPSTMFGRAASALNKIQELEQITALEQKNK